MFLWTHSQEMLVQTLFEMSVYVQVCGKLADDRSESQITNSLSLEFTREFKLREKSVVLKDEEHMVLIKIENFAVLLDEWCGFSSFYAITLTSES